MTRKPNPDQVSNDSDVRAPAPTIFPPVGKIVGAERAALSPPNHPDNLPGRGRPVVKIVGEEGRRAL